MAVGLHGLCRSLPTKMCHSGLNVHFSKCRHISALYEDDTKDAQHNHFLPSDICCHKFISSPKNVKFCQLLFMYYTSNNPIFTSQSTLDKDVKTNIAQYSLKQKKSTCFLFNSCFYLLMLPISRCGNS